MCRDLDMAEETFCFKSDLAVKPRLRIAQIVFHGLSEHRPISSASG